MNNYLATWDPTENVLHKENAEMFPLNVGFRLILAMEHNACKKILFLFFIEGLQDKQHEIKFRF